MTNTLQSRVAALSVVAMAAACGGAADDSAATAGTADDAEHVGASVSAMTVYRARLLPSAYTLRMPDAMTACGGGETLGEILESSPAWSHFTRSQSTWPRSAGDLLLRLAEKILHDTRYRVDEAEHTAAYWALMAAHDATPDAASIDVKLIPAVRFKDCREGLFGTSAPDGFLFVVAGARAIGDRAWVLNTGTKKVAGEFSPFSLDDALVCFADPANFGSARQQAIRQGIHTWLVADPPRSGVCASGRAASIGDGDPARADLACD